MKKILSMILAIFFIFASQASAMNLNVHDGDLRATIMMVARTGRLNVSVDDSVDGKISVTLIDVYPEDALEIIAKTNNLKLAEVDGIYIFSAKQNNSLMQSYVLPIQYGDAEFLRKAVVMSLDTDVENVPEKIYRVKNNDGSYSDTYTFRDNKNTTSSEKVKRDERVMVNPDVNALVLFWTWN